MNRQNQDFRGAAPGAGERTLLPMLIGGLALIVISAAIINVFV